MRRALTWGLAVALLAGCSEEAERGPAPVLGLPAIQAAARERVLYEQLLALQRLDQATDEVVDADVARRRKAWLAFGEAARGTSYEPIASARLAALARSSERELIELRAELSKLYRVGDWQLMAQRVRSFGLRHEGTPAAGRAADWGERVAGVAAQEANARVYVEAGGSAELWKEAMRRGVVVFNNVGLYGSMANLAHPGGCVVALRFRLDDVPEHLELWLQHTQTFAVSNEFTTIDIAVNGNALAVDWPVRPGREHRYRRDRWSIRPFARVGDNVIQVGLGRSSLARYWLSSMLVRAGDRPTFAAIAAE